MNVLFSAWIKYFSSLWKTIEYCFYIACTLIMLLGAMNTMHLLSKG